MLPSRLSTILLFFLIIALAEARSIRRVPQQYRTIQSAIDAARIDDTVLVDHGLYYENLRINKNIVLASRFILDRDTSHISRTIIDGSRRRNALQGSTIRVIGRTDTSCIITGLTITGGTGTYVNTPNDPVFKDWILGGGISVVDAGVRISHNIVRKNHIIPVGTFVQTSGAGIATWDNADQLSRTSFIIIEHNYVADNVVDGRWVEAPGIAVGQPGIVRHNTIVRNSSRATQRAPGGGLGLYFTLPYEIIVDGNHIRHNTAGIGGGILVGNSATKQGRAIIVNNIIAENDVFEVGGGVHVAENAWAILINNTIVGNHAGATGSGLNVANGAMATIMNNIFWKNEPRPITSFSSIRAVNNLIDGGFIGQQTIDADPMFIPGDSLFRFRPESPALGTGARGLSVGKISYKAPSNDFFDAPRPSSREENPDLGAVESSTRSNARRFDIEARWEKESSAQLFFTISLRQISLPVFSPDSTHVIRAGRFSGHVRVDDSKTYDVDSLPDLSTFTLPPHTNVLEVELLVRGLAESKLLNSYFQLEGLDAINNRVPRTRTYAYRKYVNIPPGIYRLTFYPADEYGLFDVANIKAITITVLEPWYQRWWAYALLALTVAGIITGISLYEIRRLRRERLLQQAFTQKQMEFQEFERKRLAAELHDGLGQDLLIVGNELQQFMKEDRFSRGDVGRVSELVRDSIEAVREISANLHPHHIERLGFCAAIEAMVERLSRSSPVEISRSCDDLDAVVPPDVMIHMYRVVQESLTNIVKHSQATKAQLTVTLAMREIDIRIEDNGIGFDAAGSRGRTMARQQHDRAHGFGLASMAERARIIGGTLTMDSTMGHGTTIRLRVPISGA